MFPIAAAGNRQGDGMGGFLGEPTGARARGHRPGSGISASVLVECRARASARQLTIAAAVQPAAPLPRAPRQRMVRDQQPMSEQSQPKVATGRTRSVKRAGSLERLAPGLATLARYDRRWLAKDVLAGLSVAAIALPVGLAYAALVGVPVIVGIYSAIFPLLAYAVFGSSRQLIVGPDAATCLLVAASLAPLAGGDPERYLALLFVFTLITGALYVVAGAARLGFIATFLSQPILTGYLNGIALIILVGQLPKLLGYPSAEREFVAQLQEVVETVGLSHPPTALLGLAVLAGLLILGRIAPVVPGALVAVVAGSAAVALFDLRALGVAVTGELPSGLPTPHVAVFEPAVYRSLVHDAAAVVLISFASGMLTAKSFARRSHTEIDANQELIAFGASNLVSGLAQGFPVTGADSRTAVNYAVGGKTQLVSIVAAATMLFALVFLKAPLALVPTAALAAVILFSAIGLFDVTGLRALARMSWREGLLSLGTTLGVLVLGVLPGVMLAIALSLAWLLMVASRPQDAVLGRVRGLPGFHSVADYPQASTVPGLLLYRFEANLVFFNVDYLGDRLRAAIQAAKTPVEWVIVDASPINWIDATALQRVHELSIELAAQGITLGVARAKLSLNRAFNPSWVAERPGMGLRRFPTLKAAVQAFERHKLGADEVQAPPTKPDEPV
jgi:high affinity sulfate transporter 1